MNSLEILKVAFIGSVDDGKSTLIGRIFYDQDVLLEDQKQEIIRSSQKRGTELNLALFTDGLKSEREQGITIDIAYRFFSTDQRRYIVIDCPGHAQYLRNMVTGCSQADVVVVLIDVQNGITEQTRRHIAITSLLKVPNIIFAINKMDLVDHSEKSFNALKKECEQFLKQYHYHEKAFIPISAANGDNVILNTGKISWYHGPSLFEAVNLTNGTIQSDEHTSNESFRFQIQRSNYLKHPTLGEFRGYAGIILQGKIKVGDEVKVGAEQQKAMITGIHTMDEPQMKTAQKGQSITLTLGTELDCNRGDYIFTGEDQFGMQTVQEANALIFNLSNKNIDTEMSTYLMKHGSEYLKSKITNSFHTIDISSSEPLTSMKHQPTQIQPNEIGKIRIKLQKNILIDTYEAGKHTGSFILIHPVTNESMAVGLFT
jgi:sulfate adenylyltransferase subunit 1